MCAPWCKIGGCFCTLDDDCDSHICYKWYCKAISFVPAWTLSVGISIIIVVTVLCCIYHIRMKKHYLIANVPVHYGVVSEGGKPVIHDQQQQQHNNVIQSRPI